MQTSTATLNPVLRDFWLTPARNRVLYGGRSSSKSWDAAGFAVFLATQCRIRVLCARQFQNKIAESVYTLLKIQIGRFGLTNQFVITENSIKHKLTGSEFMFYGLWRHIDEIKSLEGIDICWIEEAHNLTQEQWDILEPTLRKEGSQFWIIFNPRLVTDFVYRRFISNTPPDTIKRQINYVDNPFLSATILKVIEAKRLEDEEEFRHIYLGEPLTDDDAVIIKRSWILAAVDAHKKLKIEPTGVKRVGFDVADSGDDKCAISNKVFIGAQNLNIGTIPRVSDLTIQTVTVDLSQIAIAVQEIAREYDLRLAKADVYEVTLDPLTKVAVANPEVVFMGEVNGNPFDTPAVGDEGSIQLELNSDAISMLTRTNPSKSSYEGQKRRGGDEWGLYSSTIISWNVPWGQKRD